LRPRRRRARGRLDQHAGAGRAAAGRPRDRRQQRGGGRRQPPERRQSRRKRAQDRALGDLSPEAAWPPRRGRRQLPRRRRPPRPGDRPRRRQLAPLLPAGAGREQSGRRSRGAGGLRRSRSPQPRRKMPPRRFRRVRMKVSWMPHTKQSEAQAAPQLPAEQEPTPSPGAQEYRRRGAVLRRLLAFSDWLVLIGCLFAVTAASASTEVGTLFWATLVSPVWILVVKLHGLYDNDHRRIRHSTLDELPSLISASAVGVLVLDGLLALSPVGPLSPASAIAVGVGTLLGSFFMRGVLRLLWHRLTPVGSGIVIGSSRAVDVVARRVAIHPETRLSLVGYL